MEYVRLGTAGVKVSRLCLGTNMMGGYVDAAASAKLIDTFLECGGNFIDTADVYGQGKSEEAVGKALRGKRQQAVVATKLYSAMGEGPNDRGSSRYHIIEAAEASLRRLETDYIDLYILHYWDPETPLEESLRAMDDLVRQGKVRYVGISNFAAWQVMKALGIAESTGFDPVRSVQVQYSFLNRKPEDELFDLCESEGVTITPYWVLQAGMFTGKYEQGKEDPAGSRFAQRPGMKSFMATDQAYKAAEGVRAVAKQSGRTPTELTLAWALSKPAIGSVIAGTSRPEQVKANCAAVDLQLSDDEVQALDAIGK